MYDYGHPDRVPKHSLKVLTRLDPWARAMHGASALAHMFRKLFAEQLDAADNRAGCCVAQWAERLSSDVVAHIQQQIKVFLFASAMLQAVQNLG